MPNIKSVILLFAVIDHNNVRHTFPGVDQLLKVGGVNGRLTSGCLLPQVVEARTCRHLLEERADLLHRQRFVIALYGCRVENNA